MCPTHVGCVLPAHGHVCLALICLHLLQQLGALRVEQQPSASHGCGHVKLGTASLRVASLRVGAPTFSTAPGRPQVVCACRRLWQHCHMRLGDIGNPSQSHKPLAQQITLRGGPASAVCRRSHVGTNACKALTRLGEGEPGARRVPEVRFDCQDSRLHRCLACDAPDPGTQWSGAEELLLHPLGMLHRMRKERWHRTTTCLGDLVCSSIVPACPDPAVLVQAFLWLFLGGISPQCREACCTGGCVHVGQWFHRRSGKSNMHAPCRCQQGTKDRAVCPGSACAGRAVCRAGSSDGLIHRWEGAADVL
jgi:hypothetical protein